MQPLSETRSGNVEYAGAFMAADFVCSLAIPTQTTRSVEMDKSNRIETRAGAPESIGSDTKRAERKLSLKVDVIRTLADSEMGRVAGGWIRPSLIGSTTSVT